MYNDPSGEIAFLAAVGIGALIGLTSYTVGLAVTGNLYQWSFKGALKSTFWGAVSGAVSFGLGELFQSAKVVDALGKSKFAVQAGAHGVSQGILSVMQGGKFLTGFAGGALGSLGADLWGVTMKGAGLEKFAESTMGIVTFGALSGGIGAELSGGNFWQGAVTGGIVAGLNSAMHKLGEDPKTRRAREYKKKYKRNEKILLGIGMTQSVLFETMDFGEFNVSDIREYIIRRSSADGDLIRANELYSESIKYYKEIEKILPKEGKLTNAIKLRIIGKTTFLYAPIMIEQSYYKNMIRYLDIKIYNELFPPKVPTQFGGGGAKGEW